MYCPKCGTENKDDGKFYRNCGNDLKYHKVETEKKEISGKMFQQPFSFDGRIRRSEFGISYIITFAPNGYLFKNRDRIQHLGRSHDNKPRTKNRI